MEKGENIDQIKIIYPIFRDKRLSNFTDYEYDETKCRNILTESINKINKIIEILNAKTPTFNREEFLKSLMENNINIYLLLLSLSFLEIRLKIFVEILDKKFDHDKYLNQNDQSAEKLLTETLNKYPLFNSNLDQHLEEIKKVFNEIYKDEKLFLDNLLSLNDINNLKINNSFVIGLNILNLFLNYSYENLLFISTEKNIDKIDKQTKLTTCQNLYKIQIGGSHICNLFFIDKNSIFNYNNNSKEWENMKKNMQRIVLTTEEDMENTLNKIRNNVSIALCSMNELEKLNINNYILLNTIKGAFMSFYFFRRDKALFETDKFLLNPDINVCRKLWTLTETKEAKKLIKIVLPGIKYRASFYIKRDDKDKIDKNLIKEYKAKIKEENFEVKENYNSSENSKDDFLNDEGSELKKSNIIFSKEELKIIDKKQKQLDYIKVVLIHNKEMKTVLKNNSIIDEFLCCRVNIAGMKNKTKDSIIFQVHGGGFITLSPVTHENYTRKIVNKLGIPLLSVQYRLSPEYAFPDALDDVYQVYKWLIEYGEEDLNINLKNIILLGDSAGGNLILSLTYLLLIKGMRLPNLIVMAYPALKISINPFSLSYLNSLYDPLVDYNLLTFCLRSYVGEGNDPDDPFLSPLYMNDKIVKHLPEIKMYGATGDSLRDDYVEFLHKCLKINKKCQLKEFKYFPHGFLNYDYPFIMPQSAKITDIISEDISKFLGY